MSFYYVLKKYHSLFLLNSYLKNVVRWIFFFPIFDNMRMINLFRIWILPNIFNLAIICINQRLKNRFRSDLENLIYMIRFSYNEKFECFKIFWSLILHIGIIVPSHKEIVFFHYWVRKIWNYDITIIFD